jgi:hypothetical protein
MLYIPLYRFLDVNFAYMDEFVKNPWSTTDNKVELALGSMVLVKIFILVKNYIRAMQVDGYYPVMPLGI